MATKKAAKPKTPTDVVEMDDLEGEELTQDQLKELRAALVEKRAEVAMKIKTHLETVMEDSDNLPDEMDIATRRVSRPTSSASRTRRRSCWLRSTRAREV